MVVWPLNFRTPSLGGVGGVVCSSLVVFEDGGRARAHTISSFFSPLSLSLSFSLMKGACCLQMAYQAGQDSEFCKVYEAEGNASGFLNPRCHCG